MGRFANPQSALPSGVSARMEEPLSRDSKSHKMVVGTTTPQASRSIVVHEAVHLLPTARLSAPLHTNYVRIGSPPRVEELYDTPQFPQHEQMSAGCPNYLPSSGDAERALPSLALPIALPTGLSSEGGASELSLEGLSASSGGLILEGPSDVPAGIVHPPAVLLGMRHDVQEKAMPLQKPVVMPREHAPYSSDDSVGSPLKGIYEVETLLNVRKMADGKREFLIKWKGWGPSWNNWEPEENILDKKLLWKFNKKKRPAEVEAVSLPDAEDFTMQSKRRCAKQAAVKARMAARKEHEEEGKEDN